MGRKEKRAAKALEKNPVRECNMIQNKFLPGLMNKFSDTMDPRNASYITYSPKMMLSTVYYKNICGIVSMQDMTDSFNDDKVVNNIYTLCGESANDYLPHYVTVNEYLERLDPKEVEEIIYSIAYDSIRSKRFNDARFMGKWIVIFDGTQTYSGSTKINDRCLERHYNKGTDEETVNYHIDVLEAKIYFGENLLFSLGSEFIENENSGSTDTKEAEISKQDCETNAFKRLSEKIKKRYPRLPIVVLADSLYASEPVMDICEKYGWDYIIRYKSGSIPSISEEYEMIPEKSRVGNAEYINEIDYRGRKINVIKYHETIKNKTSKEEKNFQWITSIEIKEKNAEKIAKTGRLRWKIENEGFNRQKNWQGDITHACSHDMNALKNHYLIYQIADFVKQLYEWFYLKKVGIEKKQKNISSDLLACFGRQLISEDISIAEPFSMVLN